MSTVECFSILDIRPDVLITNISRLTGTYIVSVNIQENGHIKISLSPQLNATDKITLTTLFGKAGIVLINP